MTRTIKASEVKPGMTIRWDSGGITYQCKVGGLFPSITSGLVSVEAAGGGYIPLSRTQPVTVLSEPAPPQPEEPTGFGAAVETQEWSDDHGCNQFIWDGGDWLCEQCGVYSWEYLTAHGQVEVVNPDPFAPSKATDDTPEVPDRIEEWPEDDTALRPHPWRGGNGRVWRYGFIGSAAGWSYDGALSWDKPLPGPWTRETDA